jgi:Helix-turn-helix domain
MSFPVLAKVLRAVQGTTLTHVERLVLITLADCTNRTTGRCNPTVSYLGAVAGADRATVHRSLARLKQWGIVASAGRHRRSSLYTINPAALGSHCATLSRASKGRTVRRGGSHHATLGVAQCDSNLEGNQERNRYRTPTAHGSLGALAPDSPAPDSGPRKPRRPGAPPDRRVPALVAAFAAAHEGALGQPYLVAGGRDGAALKRALRTWGAPELTATLDPYFADPWTRDHGPTIAKWVGQVASLLARRAPSSSGGFVG